ncbi:hypothetical protein EDB81DRAFT_49877 [Dactylonectria macrodidyma]|uniref:Zinc finger PHD-type domain-containing protein n=1 Tax=Dactylonectria macrodidyma TaxID=307937 RepID=A0A9P9FUJ1_9HYPO|nr:hypothetical protein EDB81DRAFT_49877 [Dactylonectria macrodidyma]
MESPKTRTPQGTRGSVDDAIHSATDLHETIRAIKEWQANAPSADYWSGDVSVASRLCTTLLGFYEEMLRHVAKQEDVSKSIRMSLERSYSLMVLWSDAWGIREGSLDHVLSKARNIQRSMLKILSSITNALLERLKPLVVRDDSARLEELEPRLTALNAESSYLINDAVDADSDCSSDSSSGFEQDSTSEIAQDLRTDVQCLMDLDPLIRNPVFGSSSRKQKQKQIEETKWAPQQVFCDKVEQRFPQADEALVSALGQLNWARFRMCQATRFKNELGEQEQLDTVKEDHATVAGSKFHDSGLGTSLPTMSSYAETVMTYSGADGQKTRIPPLSDEARKGKPFTCVSCSRTVRVSNNSAWKRHLYSDLQPYICLEPDCDMRTFRNRSDWTLHLQEEHYHPDWKPIKCPLCLETTEEGETVITRHLAGHLEEMSLSALPTNPDEEISEAGSEHESTDDNSFKCICLNLVPDSNTIFCENCETWQHIDCYYHNNVEEAMGEAFEHLCLDCAPRPMDIEGAIRRQDAKLGKKNDVEPEELTRCVCGFEHHPGLAPGQPGPPGTSAIVNTLDEFFIQCDGCKVWQHGTCVGIFFAEECPEVYHCELCRKDLHEISYATNGQRYSQYKAARRDSQPLPSTVVIDNGRAYGSGQSKSGESKSGGSNDWDHLLKDFSANARTIFLVLYDKRKRDISGTDVSTVTFETGLSVKEVENGTEELIEQGMIYTTVDDHTWAVLEIDD